MPKLPLSHLIYGRHDADTTCWYVLGAVLMLCFFMTCLLYYQKFCYCFMKKDHVGFLDLQSSNESTESDTLSEIDRIECCSMVLLFNRRLNTRKLVFIDGEKTTYSSMDETTTTPQLQELFFNNTCVICLEDFKAKSKVIRLPCMHAYHKSCIRQWIVDKKDSKCPLCLCHIHAETVTVGATPVDQSPFQYTGEIFYSV